MATRPIRLNRFLLFACVALLSSVSFSSCGLIGRTLALGKALLPLASVKLSFKCVPEGALVDTPDGPKAIEDIEPGDIVTGFSGEPVKVLQAHAYAEDPSAEEFYRVKLADGTQVEACGNHRIAGQRAMDLKTGQELDGRTIESVETFGGVKRSYDLLTADDGYRIQGVPVNSMIEEMYQSGHAGVGSKVGAE